MAKQLDPRMIDPTKDVTYTGTRFVTPGGGSDFWNVTSSLVQANSALWEETADIIPTINNQLSTSNVQISSLRVRDFSPSRIVVSTISLTNVDSGRTFHVNTTVVPSVTAFFPGNLPNGFNVSIINAGLGTIYLSAGSLLNASGSENSTPYSGMFIYKENNELFGVGVFI